MRSTTCEPGDEPSANHQECIEIVCPPGSRKDTASLECVPCTIDEYQDKAGQTLCKKCSAGVNCSLRNRVPQVMKAAAGIAAAAVVVAVAAAPSTSRPSSFDLYLSYIPHFSPCLSLAFCPVFRPAPLGPSATQLALLPFCCVSHVLSITSARIPRTHRSWCALQDLGKTRKLSSV